jgi:glyoxylase-like metal-dependent hydrolase (beta-lactamase superfamily II)
VPQPQTHEFQLDEVATEVARLRIGFANVYFLGHPQEAATGNGAKSDSVSWVLVDAGMAMGAAEILRVAADRFGVNARPAAIILTHGHFDHVSGLAALLAVWDVPVYAHTAELPFLTGRLDYPSPDPTVAGGIMVRLTPAVPEAGVDLGERVRALPASGRVPQAPDWRWIHTPGHSPGHISLFRAFDRMLLAGDAVSTTSQESIYGSLAQPRVLSGPPAYFTIDWDKAERSVATLASLRPAVVAAGHGEPIGNATLPTDFATLARDFNQRTRPTHGRYVVQPAFPDDETTQSLPLSARSRRARWGTLSGVAAATFAGTWLYRRFGRRYKT